MSKILFKNINGKRIQMAVEEALSFEESRRTSREKKMLRAERKQKKMDEISSKLGLTAEDMMMMINGFKNI